MIGASCRRQTQKKRCSEGRGQTLTYSEFKEFDPTVTTVSADYWRPRLTQPSQFRDDVLRCRRLNAFKKIDFNPLNHIPFFRTCLICVPPLRSPPADIFDVTGLVRDVLMDFAFPSRPLMSSHFHFSIVAKTKQKKTVYNREAMFSFQKSLRNVLSNE